MGSASVPASPSVGALLREKRLALGLTLSEVSDRLASAGGRIPISTLARIEQGKLDPGVRRLYRLLQLYEVPPEQVSSLVHLDELAGEARPTGDLETLYREGVEHFKKGELSKAFAYLFAVRERVADDEASRLLRQKAIVSFAIAAADLGKFKLSKQLLEEILCEPADPSIVFNVLLALGSAWRYLDCPEAALAFLHRAEEHLPPGDPQNRAWLQHNRANVLLDAGRADEASKALEQAIACYREAGDTYGEAKALLVRTKIADAEGDSERTLACAREAVRFAEERGHERLALMAQVEFGRFLVRYGIHGDAVLVLHQVLARAVVLGDRHLQFDAHHHLWKAHEQAGDQERARIELEAAAYLLPYSSEPSPEAEEVRRQVGKRTSRETFDSRSRGRPSFGSG